MTFLLLIFLAILSAQGSPRRLCKVPMQSSNPEELLNLNFTERTYINGFSSEKHTVITEDGYILTIFRMRGCECCQSVRRTPVLLLHGLLLTSDSWLDVGPESGLPYLLSRSCYDVWLANPRGTYHGRRHIHLNADKDPEFWDFYADKIGTYDLPATVDYILNATGTQILNFVGYSQGATVFLILCSERPEYNKKFSLSILLAPATRSLYVNSELFKLLIVGVKTFEKHLYQAGVYEILTKDGFGRIIASICRDRFTAETICAGALGILDSFHPGSIGRETLSVMFDHFPAGTSVRNMAWYGQLLTSSTFGKYDYGDEENMRLYGATSPHKYNVTAVTVPSVVIYGKKDTFVNTKDVKWFVNRLPGLIESVEVKDPNWNHLDFAFSKFIKKSVFPTIDQYLREYSDEELNYRNGSTN